MVLTVANHCFLGSRALVVDSSNGILQWWVPVGNRSPQLTQCWEGFRESRRCSRDTCQESYITEYILIYEDKTCRIAGAGGGFEQVYEPYIRTRLGTAAHFWRVLTVANHCFLGSRVMVVDSSNGMLLGAVAERVGGLGTPIHWAM